jgi:hypothetical protein
MEDAGKGTPAVPPWAAVLIAHHSLLIDDGGLGRGSGARLWGEALGRGSGARGKAMSN